MSIYTIVCGSTRPNSHSLRVAECVARELASADPAGAIRIVDLATTDLPMWREEFWSDDDIHPNWEEISDRLHQTDGLIFVAPEWNGMVPPPLMNVFLLASRGEMSHKPALIVSVSSGNGGAHPVSLLRAFGFKNNQICYVPDHVIVRGDASGLFPQDPEASSYLLDRLRYSLRVFKSYTENFKNIRLAAPIDLEAYPYGM